MSTILNTLDSNDTKLSKWRQPLWIAATLVLTLSILPWFLSLMGLDFGSPRAPLSANDLGDMHSLDKQFFALAGAFHHTLLEWTAVTVAALAGFISLLHYRLVGNVKVPIIGLAFMCAGTVDAFHILASSRVITAESSNADLPPFTWALSRFFNGIIIVIGLAVNLWIYRHFGSSHTGKAIAVHGKYTLLGVGVAFFGMAFTAVFVTLSLETLPQTTYPVAFITRPLDVFPLALFILGAALAWVWYNQEKTLLKFTVLLSMAPQLITQLHMSFGSTQLFDNHFNSAHALKILAYACIFVGMVMDLVRCVSNKTQPQVQDEKIASASIDGILDVGHAKIPQAVLLPTVVFVVAVSLTIVVGGSFYFDSASLIKQQEIENIKAETNSIEPIINNLYENSSSDVRFLSRTPPIQGIISALERNDTEDLGLWRDRLEQIFSETLANRESYIQIRYIGLANNGRELINVRRLNGLINRTPQSRLQEKGGRDYVQEATKLLPNQLYFSKIEYNKEFGKVSLPLQPVLRVATPVFNNRTGNPFGLIIVNIDIEVLLASLRSYVDHQFKIYLANLEGYFIFHPDDKMQFGFEFDQANLMQTSFPQVAQAIAKNENEYLVEDIGLSDKQTSFAGNSQQFTGFYRLIQLQRYGADRSMRLLLLVDNSPLYQALIDYRNRSTLLGLALAVIALALAVLASRRVVAPLVQTTQALEQLEHHGELGPLPVLSKDEVGVLARRFYNLIMQRQAQDKELADQRYALDQHVIVAVTDIRGDIQYANKKFCDISGYQTQELMGKNHRILNSGYHDENFFREMYLTISKGKIWHGQVCNKAKQGNIYWVDTTIVPILDKNGKPHRYIALRTEITEQKQTEVDLKKAKESAEEAVRIKSEFLASMSHEIRTPMNGVLGMLNLLNKSHLNKEQSRRLGLAQDSAQSLLGLINDILDFSKVEAGKLDLEVIDFDLLKLLGDFAEAMALRCQEKNVELILDCSKVGTQFVKGDPGRLRQVLTNLVGNAIKFTDAGEVLVKADLSTAGGNRQILNCKVIDTGIGIPQDKINTLFDSFTQVDASTTRKYGGTGLGLSIVKKLCELMQGDISASSEVGKGSCFEFTVVLEVSNVQKTTLPQVDVAELSLLVVDDNATNREVLTSQFKLWGAEVVEAEDGYRALEILNEIDTQNRPLFDVAFLDMQMPGMDGAELGKRMQQDPRFEKIKLVMMTSISQRGDAQFFADLGFSAYFPKPATASDIHDALAVVTENGDSLQQAFPLVTHHYLRSLRGDAKNEGQAEDEYIYQWPSNTRILLVEDNQINQEVALGQLESIGLSADVAGNGREAIAAVTGAPDDAPYTIVLMDCQMPVMDGYEATAKIRAGAAGITNRDVPIVALTANAMKGDRERCIAAGMSDYVTKPIDELQLIKVLSRLLLNNELNHGDTTFADETGVDKSQVSEVTAHTPVSLNVPEIWDAERALKRVGGKEVRLHTLVQMFLDNMPERIERLQHAIDRQDLDNAAKTAHEIKGVLGNLSATDAMTVAGELEQAGLQGDGQQLEAILPGFLNDYKNLREHLGSYLSNR